MHQKFAVLAVALFAVGCGVNESAIDVDDGSQQGTDGELSMTSRSYVTIRRDYRKCSYPMCGGWYVSDVNRANPYEKYVYAINFDSAGLDEATKGHLLQAAAGEVVLRGKLSKPDPLYGNFQAFVVTDAWQGMPGVTVAPGEKFFAIADANITCFAAPCATFKATRLNSTATTLFHGSQVNRAALNLVDQNWLTSRVERHDALVTARFVNGRTFSTGTEKVLDASQVFVRVPDQVGPCPQVKMAPCPSGQMRVYSRNEDRCVLPSRCVSGGGACIALVPNCAPGYTHASWLAGDFACQQWACDPTFIVPPQE